MIWTLELYLCLEYKWYCVKHECSASNEIITGANKQKQKQNKKTRKQESKKTGQDRTEQQKPDKFKFTHFLLFI